MLAPFDTRSPAPTHVPANCLDLFTPAVYRHPRNSDVRPVSGEHSKIARFSRVAREHRSLAIGARFTSACVCMCAY